MPNPTPSNDELPEMSIEECRKYLDGTDLTHEEAERPWRTLWPGQEGVRKESDRIIDSPKPHRAELM